MGASERIFVDSNYFIALFNASDNLYQEAQGIARILDQQEYTFVISNFIFLEIATVLSQRCGRPAACTAGQSLLAASNIEIIHIDRTIQEESWRLFQKVESKNISFVDCSTAVLMEYENIHTLLTFDTTDFKALQKHASFRFFET